MDAYKDARYSGITGAALWLKDKFLTLPAEVNVFYQEGRQLYITKMDAVLDGIAILVEKGLNEAKDEIAKGRKAIQTKLDQQPANLRKALQQDAAAIESQFDQLEKSVEDKQNQLVDSLTQKYNEKLQAIDARIEEMKAQNKGWVDAAKEAVGGVIKTILELKNMLLGVLGRAATAVKKIIKDPIGFLGNLVAGVKQGFMNFVGNIATHLQKGLMGWLFGAIAEAGIQLPESFDLKGILNLIMQVLGATWTFIRTRAVKLLGEKVVKAMETTAEIFKILINQGIMGVWEYIKEQLSNLKDVVIEGIKSFVSDSIIKAGVTWILGLLNPAGAFIKACKAIYDIIMFFVERGSQIVALVNAVVDSVSAIADGAIGVAASAVENALGKAVPVVISFMAALLGVTGISKKIREIIEKVQAPIGKAIDWLINKAVALVKAAGKFLGFGKEKKDEKADPEHDKKVQAGLDAIDQEKKKYEKEGKIERKDAEKVAATVKAKHPVFKSLTVVDGEDSWDYDYVASPGNRYKGASKGSGQLKVASLTIKDSEKAEKVEKAKVSGADWELAIQTAVVKEIFVPRWEIILQVPIAIVFKGEKQYQYPSREDLARLKVQRGHRAGKEKGFPEITMEVKKPGGGGDLKEVRVVEVTLIEDFTKHDDFTVHKVDQFTRTVGIFKEKYGTKVPIKYYFLTPKPPKEETKDFIVGTLKSQGVPNIKVIWTVVKTK
jgi:hypothetical protein